MKIIIDTDSLIAFFLPSDALHVRAKTLFETYKDHAFSICPTTIAELSLVGVRLLGLEKTKKVINQLTTHKFIIESTTATDTHVAEALYQQQAKKEDSLCDCFVMAVAKRIQADAIFSFDKGYKKNGFKLLEEVLLSSPNS